MRPLRVDSVLHVKDVVQPSKRHVWAAPYIPYGVFDFKRTPLNFPKPSSLIRRAHRDGYSRGAKYRHRGLSKLGCVKDMKGAEAGDRESSLGASRRGAPEVRTESTDAQFVHLVTDHVPMHLECETSSHELSHGVRYGQIFDRS